MRTYLELYELALAQLKREAAKVDMSDAGERKFEKYLNRTHRLHAKALREQDTIYGLVSRQPEQPESYGGKLAQYRQIGDLKL